MGSFSFTIDTTVSPDRVLAALTDFSDKRPEIWPTISRTYYKVHSVGPTSADVTEGSDILGGVWGREHYDWSRPGTVTLTVGESAIVKAGGTWTFVVKANGSGGSTITESMARVSFGVKGRCVGALVQVAGSKLFRSNLEKTLAIIAATPVAPAPAHAAPPTNSVAPAPAPAAPAATPAPPAADPDPVSSPPSDG